jgi:hypothetical protein
MATFLYKRPVYYQDVQRDQDLGTQDLGRSMNELQTEFSVVKRQAQANSDAIVFLQEQLKLGTPTGVPMAPLLDLTILKYNLAAVGTIDLRLSWPATPGLSEVALFWEGARLVPGPAPTDTSYAFTVPMTTSPTQQNYEYGIRISNQYGTSFTRLQSMSTLVAGPRPVTATLSLWRDPTINGVWQLNWTPNPQLLPKVLGHRIYFGKFNGRDWFNTVLKDDLASATTNTTFITLRGYAPGEYEVHVVPIFTLPVDPDFLLWQSAGSVYAIITIA